MKFHILKLELQFVSRFSRIILLPTLRTRAFAHVLSEIRKMLLSVQKLFGTKYVSVIESRLYFQYTYGVRSPGFVCEITENKGTVRKLWIVLGDHQRSSGTTRRLPTCIVVDM